MTPATRWLNQQHISFEALEYASTSAARGQADNYGLQACEKLGLAPNLVFKTLMACDEHNPKNMLVAVVPVDQQLDLKALAKAAKIKRLKMANIELAERVSGYVKGGISPFAQKKQLPTYLDSSALALGTIYVSGGKRGLSLAVSPLDFCQALNAKSAAIAHK